MMTDMSRYRFVPGVSVVQEVDLDETPVYVNGERYTEADAPRDSLKTERAIRSGLIPGGKSLSCDGSHSPVLRVVLPKETAERVRQAAASQHMSVSRWLRHAVDEKLAA